jgi:hypothetical protein
MSNTTVAPAPARTKKKRGRARFRAHDSNFIPRKGAARVQADRVREIVRKAFRGS